MSSSATDNRRLSADRADRAWAEAAGEKTLEKPSQNEEIKHLKSVNTLQIRADTRETDEYNLEHGVEVLELK